MDKEQMNMDADLWRNQITVKVGDEWTVEGRPTVSVAASKLVTPSNLPGKSWINLLLKAPPNAATPPHNHNGAAVMATMVRGRMINQMIHKVTETDADGKTTVREEDSGPKVYGPGDSWYEAPGCHHVRSENVGEDGEEAQFVANMVLDTEIIEKAPSLAAAILVFDADLEESQKL